MLSGILCRAVTTVLGFVWPAYMCFKDTENGQKNNHKQWCIYWIVIVLYTALERFSDLFLFWLPLYSEAKIGLVYFLACANGADYVYTRTVAPILKQNEAQIDEKIAMGKAWVQSHISANFSWVAETLQSKMINMISMVHQFQKDHHTVHSSGAPGPASQWNIPAVAPGPQPTMPQSDASAKVASRRRFGMGR